MGKKEQSFYVISKHEKEGRAKGEDVKENRRKRADKENIIINTVKKSQTGPKIRAKRACEK
jgi:hypothetical protein